MAGIADLISGNATHVQNITIETTFSADFLDDVGKLLASIGYALTDGDEWALGFCVQKIEWEIKNACNVPAVPDGLYKVAAGLVVSEFLLAVKARSGELQADSLNFEPALKELSEGDTKQVWFENSASSGEQRLNTFIAACQQGRSQYITYRKIRW